MRVGDDTTNIFWGWPDPKPFEIHQPPAVVDVECHSIGEPTMTPEAVNLLETQLIGGLNAATTRRVDGADAHAEHSRTGYLIGKDRMSISDAMGYRTATESGSGRVRILDPA